MTAIRRLRPLGAAFAFAAVLAVALAACGGSSTPQTSLFEGKLEVGGFAFYSFTVQDTGDADVMLASVTTSTAPGSSSNVVLGLAIGKPLGEDCSITSSMPASAALQSPLVNSRTPGIYCVRVYDIGNLRSSVNFAIRIVHT